MPLDSRAARLLKYLEAPIFRQRPVMSLLALILSGCWDADSMSSHLDACLPRLCDQCRLRSLDDVKGWEVDAWEFTDQALQELADAYKTLLILDFEAYAEILREDGIDLNALLMDEGSAKDTITRSDMTELAAAAALVVAEGASTEAIFMPNVPKGSRGGSCPGMDVMAAVLSDDPGDDLSLAEGERVYVCSVKHTISDPGDMRYKLVDSLGSGGLSQAYLANQLRILQGRLQERRITCRRILLAVRPEAAGHNLFLMAVGAVDAGQRDELQRQMGFLPEKTPGHRRFRQMLISDIARLHERVT